MAKSRNKTKLQSRNAFLILILLIIILPIIAGLFFKDSHQVPYGWFITIIWLVASFFSLAFGILYYGQFVLPEHEDGTWLEGIAMLLRAATLSAPPPKRSAKNPAFPGQEHLPTSFDSLRAGVLRSYQVLSLSRGTQYTRAAGPGYVRLFGGESISQVIDLRTHVRSQDVAVNTRDGIPLITEVKVVFRIKQPSAEETDDRFEYQYSRTAVFQVSQAGTIDAYNELLNWTEQLAPQAASYLVSEMAQFTFNELSQQPDLVTGVQHRVRRQLIANFDNMGIKIFSVGVALHDPPEDIMRQRLENWRAPWQSQIQAQVATSNANTLRRMKDARASAQVEIIQNIMTSIEQMRVEDGTSLQEVVTLRMIDALDEAMSSSNLQTYLPNQVLETLVEETANQMHSLLYEGDEEEVGDD